MAPWQTPDRDQLTAKYLIRPFALTQLAWLPWSNGVSCTHAKGCWGLRGAGSAVWGLPGCTLSAHPHSHQLPIFTAQCTPTASPHSHTCVLHLWPAQLPTTVHSCSPQQQSQGCVGQRPQPLGCFTTCCSSLWPVKSICGSACGDKLFNCVCRRFMLGRDGGGGRGDALAAAIPSLQGCRACEGGSRAAPGIHGNPAGIAPLQICKSSAAPPAPARADSAARGRASPMHLPAWAGAVTLQGPSPSTALPWDGQPGTTHTTPAHTAGANPTWQAAGLHPALAWVLAPSSSPGSRQTPTVTAVTLPAPACIPSALCPSLPA